MAIDNTHGMPEDADKCSRTVCTSTSITHMHRQTGAGYCAKCARKINDANPMPDGLPLVIQVPLS